MKRWFLLIVTLTLISTLALAQAVITPSGQATTQGAAVPMAPISPPLVTTPLIHLGTAATTNGNAATGEPPSQVPIRPEISLGPANVYVGQTAVIPANSETNETNANATEQRRAVNLGVSSSTAMTYDDGTHGRSLGEIARENRQRMQNANARTFTNADVERAGGTGGVSGVATNPANAGYPADNGVINSSGIATQTGTAAPANGQKPEAATAPHEMAQAQTPANPADQAAGTGAAADQNTEQRTLPKSASPLPLLALLGFTATGAGLLARKLRT